MKFILLPATQPGVFDSAFSHVAICVTEELVMLVKEARKSAAEFFGTHNTVWGCLTVRGSLLRDRAGISAGRTRTAFRRSGHRRGGRVEIAKADFDKLAEAKGAHSLDCAGFSVWPDSVDFVGYGKHYDGEIDGRTTLEMAFFRDRAVKRFHSHPLSTLVNTTPNHLPTETDASTRLRNEASDLRARMAFLDLTISGQKTAQNPVSFAQTPAADGGDPAGAQIGGRGAEAPGRAACAARDMTATDKPVQRGDAGQLHGRFPNLPEEGAAHRRSDRPGRPAPVSGEGPPHVVRPADRRGVRSGGEVLGGVPDLSRAGAETAAVTRLRGG